MDHAAAQRRGVIYIELVCKLLNRIRVAAPPRDILLQETANRQLPTANQNDLPPVEYYRPLVEIKQETGE